MISIQILGYPRLLTHGQTLRVSRRKARALAFYVAAHTNVLGREQLQAILWSHLDRPEAQHAVRATLYELRGALGDSLIIDNESVSLAPGVEVDARLFQSRLSPVTRDLQMLTEALELYRGDFLDGFSLPDCPEFEEWASLERERYRRLEVRGLSSLAEMYRQRGDFIDALEALKRALNLDPLQEELERACMQLHCLAGDRAAAIRRYHTLRKLLNDELGVPPMPETQAVYDAIISDDFSCTSEQPAAAAPPMRTKLTGPTQRSRASVSLPFVGRQAEMGTLQALRSSSTGQLVLVEGEPGFGKTRLVEEFMRESGALAMVAVAHELEEGLPYQPLVEMLRRLVLSPEWPAMEAKVRATLAPVWQSALERLLPEMATASPARPLGPEGDRQYLWEAVNQLLQNLGNRQPVILFFDDLQWADDSTLAILGYLVRQTRDAAVLFIAASRPIASGSKLAALLQTLTREENLLRLEVSRLRPEDISHVAERLSPAYSHVLAEWLMRASEGNPYVLAELVRHARESGLLLPSGVLDLHALSSAPILPQRVNALILSRLERLSEVAHRMLDIAAVAGRVFEFEVVARAAALSESAALDGIDELEVAGLIRPLGDTRYTFDHSLTMEVASRKLSEARRQAIHRRVGEALETIHHNDLESHAGVLALHFAEGRVPDRAVPFAIRAGNQAKRLAAWTEAIAFYRQALAVSEGPQRLFLLETLSQIYSLAKRAPEAAETAREAAVLARSLGETASAEFLMGMSLMYGWPAFPEFVYGALIPMFEEDDFAQAIAHLSMAEALHSEDSDVQPETYARIRIAQATIASSQGDFVGAAGLYREILDVTETLNDQEIIPLVAIAHGGLASCLNVMNDPEALEHALSGLRTAQETGIMRLQPDLHCIVGEIALAGDNFDTAETYLTEGLAQTERLSIAHPIPRLQANLGLLALRRGKKEEAVRRLSEALSQADARGSRHLAAQTRLWLIPLLPPSEAHVRIEELRAMAGKGGSRFLVQAIARLEQEIV